MKNSCVGLHSFAIISFNYSNEKITRNRYKIRINFYTIWFHLFGMPTVL